MGRDNGGRHNADRGFARTSTIQQFFGLQTPVGKEDIVLRNVGEVVDDPTVDLDSNELHAGVWTTCPRCKAVITPGAAVQRMVTGAYEHQICPKSDVDPG